MASHLNMNMNMNYHNDSDDDNFSQTSQNSHSSNDSNNSAAQSADRTESVDALLTALDDLQGRIVNSLNTFQHHPGIKSSSEYTSIHVELQEVLRPVLEISAHVAPSTARTYAPLSRPSVDSALEEVYARINSDLILPVLRVSAQSETNASKRAAALAFFPALWKEWRSNGSWLDVSDFTGLGGLYGTDESYGHKKRKVQSISVEVKNARSAAKSVRLGELLRNWIEGATACTVPGSFTSERKEGSIVSRAVISSGAVIRPALKLITKKISEADDAGALLLYLPVMRMITGVLSRLFNDNTNIIREDDGLKSACIKFLEIVILCFSSRMQAGDAKSGKRGSNSNRDGTSGDDFALDDLPAGHPVITKQALEEMGEDAFRILRGLLMIGGQVKVDLGVKRDIMTELGLDSSGSGSPSKQIGAILKPAALSYLEIESSQSEPDQIDENSDSNNNNKTPKPLDRSNLELDFELSHKSYAVTINAIAMLAIHRPMFFQDSATCIARRVLDPPPMPDMDTSSSNNNTSTHNLSNTEIVKMKSTAIAIRSHLKASCLTLLRHTRSITTNSSTILHTALARSTMKLQADKALQKAKDDLRMKHSSRALRNQAAILYEWDQTTQQVGGGESMEDLNKRRHRAGDDALERMRQARTARGLGNGIRLPSNMVDAVELILVNLGNLPSTRASVMAGGGSEGENSKVGKKRKRPMTLDFVVDAVLTNGGSLMTDESRWYKRDGGNAWIMDVSTYVSDDDNDYDKDDEDVDMMTRDDRTRRRTPAPVTFTLDTKTFGSSDTNKNKKKDLEDKKKYGEQCKLATSDAFSRIVSRSSSERETSIANFGNCVAARLAWCLKGVMPSGELGDIHTTLQKDLEAKTKNNDDKKEEGIGSLVKEFPLVAPCFALDMKKNADKAGTTTTTSSSQSNTEDSLTKCILNEAYLHDRSIDDTNEDDSPQRMKPSYERCLSLYVSTVVDECKRADERPNDAKFKKVASFASSILPKRLATAPVVTSAALELTSALCDIDGITRRNNEASKRSSSKQNIAASAALHAAKQAAEKRATFSLLTLRDVAFQYTDPKIRRSAVKCVVGIVSGRLPASPDVESKALRLVMNALFPKSKDLAEIVVECATEELNDAASYAIENREKIEIANKEAQSKRSTQSTSSSTAANPLLPQSEEEKKALNKVQKSVPLFVALCKKRPDLIKTMMQISSREGADVLTKAVRKHMPLLARLTSATEGAAKIALQVAEMTDDSETRLLLAFLDNLVPSDGKNPPNKDLIDACHKIQSDRFERTGEKDARFVIPVVSGISRKELVDKLPEFVAADDVVFKAALRRMSECVTQYAHMFRDDDATAATTNDGVLNGMTLCEQLVYLHRMDFSAHSLPQKRYLDAIRQCLDDEEVFTHSVIMAALDYISGTFLLGENLPLAYMRTIILTCTKYDSLHPWICDVLLPRLIDGHVYNDRRQWEGWMRCAKRLENTEDDSVSSIGAIRKLPEEQYRMYRARYP